MCRLQPETFSKEDDVIHPAQNKRNRVERPSPPFDAGRKLGEIDKTLPWKLLNEEPECPSRVLLDKVAQTQTPLPVRRIGSING